MHGTKILEEADRLMTVCNSCRYCEGLCAVFPAMEMRRAFSDGDLNYLANLCHGCGACYTDCQFSPPHEFNVNVPKTLAIARAESYAAYAWPRAFSGAFARNGLVISLIAALSVAAFIFGFAAFNDRQVLFGVHTGAGRVLQIDAAQRDGGAVRRGVPLCDRGAGDGRARVLARHRRARRHEDRCGSLWQAIRDAGELRYLDGGGVGCFNEDDRPTDRRKIYHHLTFYGFVLCFAATCVATLYHYLLAREAPYAWWDLPVVLGTLGGIGLLIGPVGLLAEKWKRDPVLVDESALRHGHRLHRDAVPDQPDRHGAVAVARYGGDGAAAGAASRRGVLAVHHHALRQIRARHLPLRRAGALCAGAADDGGARLRT